MIFCFFFFLFLSCFSFSPLHQENDNGECVANYLSSNGFQGQVGLPGSQLYNQSINIDNVFAVKYPAIAVAPSNDQDVATTIAARQFCNVGNMSILSGGHSAAGYCLCEDGVVINMNVLMTSVDVHKGAEDSMVVRASVGARWFTVYDAVVATAPNYVVIGGGCPQVGLGGFLMGGGWSFLSRSYGLAADSVIEATFVLGNGSVVTASSEEHSDLWWASKGGGGGNFGVMTSVLLQLHKTIADDGLMLVGQLCWPPFSPKILPLWEMWLNGYDTMPYWQDLDPSWLPTGVNNSRMFCFTVICNNEEAPCQDSIQPYRDFKPVIDTVERQNYQIWESNHYNITDAQGGDLYLTSGILLPGATTLELVAKFVVALKQAPSNRSLILFHVGGGAIQNISSNATAFPHRNVELVLQAKAIWSDESESAANIQWVNDVREMSLPYLNGSYVNYIDPNFPNFEDAYYGENYPRLVQVAERYDPDKVFTFPQAIRP